MTTRVALLASLALLAACASVKKDEPIQTLVVGFKKGAHRQHVRAVPPAVVTEERFDVALEDYGDFEGRIRMSGGGLMRNLDYIGSGDEGAFRRLAALAAPWHLRPLDAAAAAAGVAMSDRAGYWSPNGPNSNLDEGMIVAIRDWDKQDRAMALLFVKSVAPGTLTLLVAKPATGG